MIDRTLMGATVMTPEGEGVVVAVHDGMLLVEYPDGSIAPRNPFAVTNTRRNPRHGLRRVDTHRGKGWLHRFGFADEVGGLAIVELDSGEVREMEAHRLRFLDVEGQS